MLNRTELKSGPVSVVDYRCTAGPAEKAFAEVHRSYSVSYVRKGSFGYRTRGQTYELVAGSVLAGRVGDEFMCTHDHHVCGDECLAFHMEADAAEAIGLAGLQSGGLPPLPELMVIGELAQAAVDWMNSAGCFRPTTRRSCRRESGLRWLPAHAIAAVRSRRRCGSTNIRTSKSIWAAQRARLN